MLSRIEAETLGTIATSGTITTIVMGISVTIVTTTKVATMKVVIVIITAVNS